MLKALALDDHGQHLLIVAITEENIERLRDGQSCSLELPPDTDVAGVQLMYGKDELAVLNEFEEAGLVPPGTATAMGARIDQLKAELGSDAGEVKLT